MFRLIPGWTLLQNGSRGATPTTVQDSLAREADSLNGFFLMPGAHMGERYERTRNMISASINADPSQVALLRSTTEGMRTVQFGLPFSAGDEVLRTDLDYDPAVWRQSAERFGVRLKTFPLSSPRPETGRLLDLYRANITPRTRYAIVSHVVSPSGEVMPVKEICALFAERGIPVLVDAAQSYGLARIDVQDIGCAFLASSLHKWFNGPMGTGFLYMRKEWVQKLWPLFGDYADETPASRQTVWKFENYGGAARNSWLAVPAAFELLDAIPPEVRLARLVYLRERWMTALARDRRVTIRTSRAAGGALGMGLFKVDGVSSEQLVAGLKAQKISVKLLVQPSDPVDGIRVSPAIYSSAGDVDRFVAATQALLNSGTLES